MKTTRTTSRRALAISTLLGVAWMFPGSSYAQAPSVPQQDTAIANERQARDADDPDDRLERRIAYRIETDETLRKYDVDVDVDGGVATLTGEVATEAQRDEAVRIAEAVDGVTRIADEIEVDADADQTIADRTRRGLSKTGEAIDDAWITTKVNWFFMGEDALEGSDINVDTEGNVVTLEGTVRSAAGRARAVELARQTEGVKDVRDQLTVAAAAR
jgi:osmotically-inducible protein OsmY